MLRRGGALISLGLALLAVTVAIGVLFSPETTVEILLFLTFVLVALAACCAGIFTLLKFLAYNSLRVSSLVKQAEAIERKSQILANENMQFKGLVRELQAENTLLADKLVRSKSN